jgi:hypothetical protein
MEGCGHDVLQVAIPKFSQEGLRRGGKNFCQDCQCSGREFRTSGIRVESVTATLSRLMYMCPIRLSH